MNIFLKDFVNIVLKLMREYKSYRVSNKQGIGA